MRVIGGGMGAERLILPCGSTVSVGKGKNRR